MSDSKNGNMQRSIIATVMEECLDRALFNFSGTLDTQLQQHLGSLMEKRLKQSESMILEEIELTRRQSETKMDKLQRNFNELNQYYHITKLENDNTALLLKLIEGLSRRIEALEKGT